MLLNQSVEYFFIKEYFFSLKKIRDPNSETTFLNNFRNTAKHRRDFSRMGVQALADDKQFYDSNFRPGRTCPIRNRGDRLVDVLSLFFFLSTGAAPFFYDE